MRGVFQDLVGNQYGRLTVVKRVFVDGAVGAHWQCICECGKSPEKPIGTNRLLKGITQSCGCLMVERVKKSNTKHGYYGTPTYIVWRNMWARCTQPKHKSYEHYKSFVPCSRWEKFENFLIDMGERPAGKTLDRIDNNKGYSPENCRWADAYVQQGNTKRNIFLVIDGERLCLKAACRKVGVPYGLAKNRVHIGWTPEKAVFTPKTNKWRSNIVETNVKES